MTDATGSCKQQKAGLTQYLLYLRIYVAYACNTAPAQLSCPANHGVALIPTSIYGATFKLRARVKPLMGDHVGSVDHLDCSKRSKQSPQLGKILPSIKLYVHPALPRDRYNSQHPSGQPTEETKLKKTSGRKKASSASNNNPGLSNYPVGSMAAMETVCAFTSALASFDRSC